MKNRVHGTSRIIRAGCFACLGSTAKWHGPNAQGVAARHHDATGHQTWVDVTLSIVYGRGTPKASDPQQLSLPTSPPAPPPAPRRRTKGRSR